MVGIYGVLRIVSNPSSLREPKRALRKSWTEAGIRSFAHVAVTRCLPEAPKVVAASDVLNRCVGKRPENKLRVGVLGLPKAMAQGILMPPAWPLVTRGSDDARHSHS